MTKKTLSVGFFAILLTACQFGSSPGAIISWNLKSTVNEDFNVQNSVNKFCEENRCLNYGTISKSGDSLLSMGMVLNNNETVYIKSSKSDKGNDIKILLTQKEKTKISVSLFNFLNNIEKNGTQLEVVHSEEWHCRGKELEYKNCSVSNVELKEAFIPYLKSYNSKF